MVNPVLAETGPNVIDGKAMSFSNTYLDTLGYVGFALETLTESPEVTQGQMAWLDDKFETLWEVADVLEVKIPRAFLDIRVELLGQVTN